MTRAHILGTGAYAPSKILTNQDLEKMIDTSHDWIVERTGIHERRVAADDEQASDMVTKASIRALEMAGTRADELDYIIVGTISGDMPMPSTACVVQSKLGATKACAFDLSAACAGSMFALSVADQFIKTGMARRILIAGVEMLTRIVDWTDRNTCVLFGDAAGAMVLGPSPDPARGVLSTHLHSDGNLWDILYIPAGGTQHPASHDTVEQRLHYVKMNGREVYKVAVRSLTEASLEALRANHLEAGQVDCVIAHQANIRIIEAVMERLKIPLEKCWLNIDKYGNTSSASMPTTLDEANRAGRLKPGQHVLLMAIGAGMAWGTGMLRW
jgi:3-oxoacyl-[acyl-carrier-protein] synthase III